jgi:antirestriction protein ArdC
MPYTIPRPKHTSEKHALILSLAAQDNGCNCVPYVNWATYRIWRSVGRQVQAGEKGIKLVSYPTRTHKDDKTGKKTFYKAPRGFTVFCECQTKEV